jgi:hypothetical protein
LISGDPVDAPVSRAFAQQKSAIGVLDDGTPYYAPIGQITADDSLVTCHLCGRSYRSVTAHLASHGWTKAHYCTTFGLERSQSLEGAETRKLRSTAFSARLIFEPALRTGSALGRDRARTGDLTRAAADAARGRPFPEQRRRRSRQGLTAAAGTQVARANRERADRRIASVASQVALQRGYPCIGQLVQDRIEAGLSLAAISRECGLDKDWMSRHLERLDPAAAALAANRGECRAQDARWSPVIRRLGFDDVASYLRQRHHVEHKSVNAIAREVGLSFPTVKAALQRHGLNVSSHASKRYAAERRGQEVAASLGVASIQDFVERRRAAGWTWREMAAESGQPQTWLRRHAAGER